MGDVNIDVLLTAMRRLDDDAIVGALAGAAAVANCAERMLTVGAGVVAERSRREAGHSGLAAKRGHRNAVSLVQSIVGGTRTDAARAVRLGETLIEGADAAGAGSLGRDGSDRDGWGGNGWGGSPGDGGDGWSWGNGAGYGQSHADGATGEADAGFEHGGTGAGAGPAGTGTGSGDPGDGDAAGSHTGSSGPDGGASGGEGVGGGASRGDAAGDGAGAGAGVGVGPHDHDVRMPWHEPLRQALFEGTITPAQHDAIFRGMGQPPARDGADRPTDAMIEVWSLAAAQLAQEAADMSVEDLARRARQVRDTLDPQGVQERFERSYAARSWRSWRNADGQHHTHIISDDETAAWLESIRDAALRPRRGGPRFMTDEERAAASALVDDPRTNDQIAYDLFMDILRAGALANAADVFGARQPGIRIVTVDGATGVRDAFGRMLATGHLEDRGDALPGSVVDRNLCTVGSRSIIVDSCGNPLDVGREQRLFTARQRVALAVRDGGCMFPQCRVPASYCETHHCDHWHEDLGLTDIDRGILLCRHHHMLLHNNGWKITREGLGSFMLHPPGSRRRGGPGGREAGGGSGGGGGSGNDRSSGGGDREPIPLTSRSAIRWAWDPPPEWPHWRSVPTDGTDPRLAHSA
ncbi:HNH endonuclease signature motif containing protein [Microbacterium sp.]|uniref:HNH endonuclease signature motif containing protein n=1 Tax=Microbacterium sp. TaxID=51671 RepID=UPI0027365058|nr:HNH endonuclease signature motif containing protein [Microbacterium sp.]MDP3949070.1 DUF222 domain-containing protein [Microbacterium sp.]